MNTTKLFLFILACAQVACSKPESTRSLSSDSLPQISAKQDMPFTYTLASSGSGAFTITALPAWASFNSTTGVLSGTPRKYSDAFDFTAVQASAPNSPLAFHVAILGNPMKEYQWHLGNTGQTAFASLAGVSGNDVHLTNTIAGGITGAGVTIAISDSGVTIAHEGLAANVLPNLSRNYLNDYATTGSWIGDPTPDFNSADDAHGTAVAGLAAEKGWNNLGGRGVAPDAQIAGFKFIQAQDQLAGENLYDAAFLDQFAGSFDIYNYSWGDAQCELTEYGTSLSDKIAAGTSQRHGLGAIFVRAAGNSYFDALQDCVPTASATAGYLGTAESSELNTSPYEIIVGASNANGVASSYSSPGANLWVSSPGGEYGLEIASASDVHSGMPALISTDVPGCGLGLKSFYYYNSNFDRGLYLNGSCNYTSTMNGTSGATPIVSGAVALLLQANSNLSWRDVKHILASTADKIDATVNPATHPVSGYNLAGHTYEQGWVTNTAGFHFMNYYGFGRINVDNAVSMAKLYTSNLGTYTQTGWSGYDSGTAAATAIPAGTPAGLNKSFTVSETLTVEEVQLRVAISSCISFIGLELVSPTGTRSHLTNINSGISGAAIADHTYLSNAFYGEPSAGTWTINVIDAKSSCNANLTHWALNIYGH